MQAKPLLWGIDGSLVGNEGRLFACLPFFRLEGRIGAARSANWALPDKDVVWFSSEEEALQHGTRLGLPEVQLEAGSLIVLIGPLWLAAARMLSMSLPPGNELIKAQGGFFLSCLGQGDYKRVATSAAEESRGAFDQALSEEKGKRINAALLALAGNGFVEPEDLVIRRLVAAIVRGDNDLYGELLRIA